MIYVHYRTKSGGVKRKLRQTGLGETAEKSAARDDIASGAALCCYREIHPSTLAMELSRMMDTQMGARYFRKKW